MTSLWWIRRDLRLTDDPTLRAALEAGEVVPVFILNPRFESTSPRRRDFLHEGLYSLDKDLRARPMAGSEALVLIHFDKEKFR